jgi:tripartite ATP-independent transporter DctM subunit
MAGVLPAGLMALALIAVAVAFGSRQHDLPVAHDAEKWEPVFGKTSCAKNKLERDDDSKKRHPALNRRAAARALWGGAAVTIGLIAIIFGGFKSGFATATEISAFAAVYALLVGALAFRELTPRAAAASFVSAATRSGLVMFIVAAAQSLAFVLTLQQVPHALAEALIRLSHDTGTGVFMLLSIAILIVMGSVLEGAAALIIFGPLLVPVAAQLGIAPLHFGVVLVIAMGIGLFAPPLGLGLYGACLIGNVPIEDTVKPMLGYLGLLLVCLLVIAFVPAISLWLPTVLGY